MSALTAAERETIVNTSDADDLVRVWTSQRREVARLRKDAAFTQTASGFHGLTEWAEFTIPADRWSPAGVKRSRTLRAESLANLAGGRKPSPEGSSPEKPGTLRAESDGDAA